MALMPWRPCCSDGSDRLLARSTETRPWRVATSRYGSNSSAEREVAHASALAFSFFDGGGQLDQRDAERIRDGSHGAPLRLGLAQLHAADSGRSHARVEADVFLRAFGLAFADRAQDLAESRIGRVGGRGHCPTDCLASTGKARLQLVHVAASTLESGIRATVRRRSAHPHKDGRAQVSKPTPGEGIPKANDWRVGRGFHVLPTCLRSACRWVQINSLC